MIDIHSLQNEKIKACVRLRERRERDKTQTFLIEGYRELKRAVEAGWKLTELYICPDLFLGDNEQALIQQIKCPVFRSTSEVFAKISYRDRPDGLLGIAPQRHPTLQEVKTLVAKKAIPFLLVAESIEKPGNLGTILRSSDAAGVDAVIVCDPTTDIYNPNVVRSSVGTLFTLLVVQADSLETLRWLKEEQILIVAATPHAPLEFTQTNFQIPLAIAVGTEQYGLSPQWMEQSDMKVKIPMLGIADSLNVASATTLLLYEVVRQRRLG